MAEATVPAELGARTDAAGHLLAAAEPLAALQLRCGGTVPGPIAIPDLAELVARAGAYRLRLARAIAAEDGHETVRAWAEVVPEVDAAVRRVVESVAPYPPFPPALAREFDVVEIRRTWTFDTAVRLQ